jgi:predicted phage tail protein
MIVGRLLWPCDEPTIVFVSVAVVRPLISIVGVVAAVDGWAVVVVDEIIVAAVGRAGYKMSAVVVGVLVVVMIVEGVGVVLPTIANTCNSNDTNNGRNTYSTCFWGARVDSLPTLSKAPV